MFGTRVRLPRHKLIWSRPSQELPPQLSRNRVTRRIYSTRRGFQPYPPDSPPQRLLLRAQVREALPLASLRCPARLGPCCPRARHHEWQRPAARGGLTRYEQYFGGRRGRARRRCHHHHGQEASTPARPPPCGRSPRPAFLGSWPSAIGPRCVTKGRAARLLALQALGAGSARTWCPAWLHSCRPNELGLRLDGRWRPGCWRPESSANASPLS